VRQLTGEVEQLQYRNQQLEQQLRGAQAAPASVPQRSAPPQPQYAPPSAHPQQTAYPQQQQAYPQQSYPQPSVMQQAREPGPPPRNPSGTGAQQMVMAPSNTPKDEYDLAYGYVLRKDYALAEEGLRAFLKKHPNDRLVADANYWLGESLFQRQRYREAAESFLAVSTKFDTAGKAPDSLLRLGQSLAALKEKDAACATLGELPRKYPKA